MFYTLQSKFLFFFALTCLLVVALFISIDQVIKINSENEELKRQYFISHTIAKLYNLDLESEVENYLMSANLYKIEESEKILNIISNAKNIFNKALNIGFIRCYELNDVFYLQIDLNNSVNVIMYASKYTPNLNRVILIAGLFMALLVFFTFYYFTLKDVIRPLKKLSVHIKNWNVGNHHIFKYSKNDEISTVVKEVNKLTRNINELIQSRQFFIRSIMHELKTPIGKGKILVALFDESAKTRQLDNIFDRLNMLLNEFNKIEQILTKNYTLNIQTYRMHVIYEQALDMLMIEPGDARIAVKVNAYKQIDVDLELFSMLIKNLLDNALKYSSDGKCEFVIDEDKISVINNGVALKQPFEYYIKTFVRGESTNNTHGFGLGLYLIDYICTLHNFTFAYHYDTKHHFKVIF